MPAELLKCPLAVTQKLDHYTSSLSSTLGDKIAMLLFLQNALAGREILKRVLMYCAAFCFVAGFIGSYFNDAKDNIRMPVFVVLYACTFAWMIMLWRCADNSVLNRGWFIRLCIATGVVGILLSWVLA